MPSLNVWMNGERVGEWTTSRSGTPVFRYTRDWAESPRAGSLSLSLPLTADREVRGPAVAHYFDNLLPDSPDIRRRTRDRFGLRSADTFDLLEAIGRDCVGAVQLLPPDQEPARWNRVDAQPLSIADVERILRDVTAPVLGGRDHGSADFRISIAGAQEKTALLSMGGAWFRPLNATPTTHILKLPLGVIGNFRGDFSHSVENEWLCAQFLRELGLPVAEMQMATFGEQRALVVTRFDRRWVDVDEPVDQPGFRAPSRAWIARLPQEDFCQVTGRSPSRRYESDGGPTIEDIVAVLANSHTPALDQGNFLLAQVAFWLLAATDGHAKNFSIRLRAGNAFSLTPLYDVISAWPVIGRGRNQLSLQDVKLAMGVAGRRRHYRLLEILARHWQGLALRTGGPELWSRVNSLVESAESAMGRVAAVLPRGFPETVYAKISAGVTQQVARFRIDARRL
jgi:serine/threonine-protein kinase HipA